MRKDAKNIEFTITGKPALILLGAIILLFLWRVAITHDSVAPEVEERLRDVLAAEYASTILPDIQSKIAQHKEKQLSQDVQRLLSTMKNITFPSLKSRGGRRPPLHSGRDSCQWRKPPKGKGNSLFPFPPLHGNGLRLRRRSPRHRILPPLSRLKRSSGGPATTSVRHSPLRP